MQNKFKDTKFITGLKALAVLSVFLIHSGGAGLVKLSAFTYNLVDYGKYGIVSYFIISIFAAAINIDRNKHFTYKSYLLNTYLSIAPAYYAVSTIMFFFGGSQIYLNYFHLHNSLRNLFYHLIFFNILDARYRETLIASEWIVPVLFFYELLLPFFLAFVKSNPKRMFHLLLLSLAFSLFCKTIYVMIYDSSTADLLYHWSLEQYFFTIMFGVFTYFYFEKFKKYHFNSLHLLELFLLLSVVISLYIPYPEFYISIWTGLLILICSGKSRLSKILFENKIIQFFGKISFSFYLVHFPILLTLPTTMNLTEKFLVGLLITTIVGSVLYYLVEATFIKLAGKISDRSSLNLERES